MENKKHIDELSEKVLKGVNEAVGKLIESSAASDKSLVVGDKYGNVKKVPAKELLLKLKK